VLQVRVRAVWALANWASLPLVVEKYRAMKHDCHHHSDRIACQDDIKCEDDDQESQVTMLLYAALTTLTVDSANDKVDFIFLFSTLH
jgi:hypothetical protein